MKKLILILTLTIAFNITYADNPPASYQKLKQEFKTLQIKKDYKKPQLTTKQKSIIGASLCASAVVVQTIWIQNENQMFFKTIPYIMVGAAVMQLIFMGTSETKYQY
jgi:hypothetical protein